MLEWLDSTLHQASRNLAEYVEAFVAARTLGCDPPPLRTATWRPQPATRIARMRNPPRKIKATLHDLLDNVSEAFESASLPMDSYQRLPGDFARGLRKIGPWVPFGSPWEPGQQSPDRLEFCAEDLPGIFCLSRGMKSKHFDGFDVDGDGGYGVVAFAAGQKLAKPPWYVEQVPGTHYSFWLGFRYKKTIQWVDAEMVIRTDGTVCAVGELATQAITLPNGRQYHRRSWRTPLIDNSTVWDRDRNVRRQMAINIFMRVMNWWMRRNDRWIVAVRKNMQRVTFSVEPSLTKDFFADREKTTLNVSGKPKKIIHYVRSHDRALRDDRTISVREHIRGLREFDWRGYHCTVTAPRFHIFNIGSFPLGGVDEDDIDHSEKWMDTSQIAGLLVAKEDGGQKYGERR